MVEDDYDDMPAEEERLTIGGREVQRERLLNIWRSEIDFRARMRRQNGAALIAMRMVEGTDWHYDRISDFVLDTLQSDDMFIKVRDDVGLIDTWGKDMDSLFVKCQNLHGLIPRANEGKGEKHFQLQFSMVMGIPFSEMRYTDTLGQVLHRVLTLLHENEERPELIPYDHFFDLERTEEQLRRLKDNPRSSDFGRKDYRRERREEMNDSFPRLF